MELAIELYKCQLKKLIVYRILWFRLRRKMQCKSNVWDVTELIKIYARIVIIVQPLNKLDIQRFEPTTVVFFLLWQFEYPCFFSRATRGIQLEHPKKQSSSSGRQEVNPFARSGLHRSPLRRKETEGGSCVCGARAGSRSPTHSLPRKRWFPMIQQSIYSIGLPQPCNNPTFMESMLCELHIVWTGFTSTCPDWLE